jgi:hypothetical protein
MRLIPPTSISNHLPYGVCFKTKYLEHWMQSLSSKIWAILTLHCIQVVFIVTIPNTTDINLHLAVFLLYLQDLYNIVLVFITGKERGEVATKHHIVKLHTFVTLAVYGVNDHLHLSALYPGEGGDSGWLWTHCYHPSIIFCLSSGKPVSSLAVHLHRHFLLFI